MYRSIYDYVGNHTGAIPIRVGEHFKFIEQHDENWWKMRSQTGRVGLVPACYLEPLDKRSVNPASERQAVLESIERAIETIHVHAAHMGGKYTSEQRANLRKLLEHRKRILSGQMSVPTAGLNNQPSSISQPSLPAQPRRPAPARPPEQEKLKPEVRKESSKRRPAPSAPNTQQAATQRAESSSEDTQDQSPSSSTVSVEAQQGGTKPVKVRTGVAAELLELLRINTGLSYEKSFVAVHTVLSHIQDSVAETSDVVGQILHDLLRQKKSGNSKEDEAVLLSTHDGQQLTDILNKLTEHKEDSQQRSWAVYEDEGIIAKLIKNLTSILLDADPAVCRAVLRQDDYEYIHMLVVFYQMEERLSLRQSLVEVFGCMCGLEKEVLIQLLCYVLPAELARDIMTRKDKPMMQCHCALLLSMILSTGEAVPFALYDQMNESFVDFVIGVIENSADCDYGEQLVEAFVPLILAFNQHFIDFRSNIVMRALASCGTAKILSEQIMLLINREEDPVKIFDYPCACPDSVLKFLADIFSCPETAGFFYTSDMMVLIEIVLRQVADLSPGEKMRTEYLSLLHQILTNSNYSEHKHKADDIALCLKRISGEEDKEAEPDKLIVAEILRQFSTYFT